MTDETTKPDERPIGWLHAIVATLIILVVGIGVLVYGSNAVLTRAHRLTRNGQVAIVTPLFFVFLFGLGWVLRRLQQRKII